MKVLTENLTDLALDWAVAVAEGKHPVMRHERMRTKAAAVNFTGNLEWHLSVQTNDPINVDESGVTWPIDSTSTDWVKGGEIITREWITVGASLVNERTHFTLDNWYAHKAVRGSVNPVYGYGADPLTAAMRCWVTTKLGKEVEIPDELFKN